MAAVVTGTVDWALKAGAFLAGPLDAALLPGSERAARIDELLGAAGCDQPAVASAAKRVAAQAMSADRPPRAALPDTVARVAHPLAGRPHGRAIDPVALRRSDAAAEVARLRQLFADDRLFFLAMWRFLPDMLGSKARDWYVLPADTLLPDWTFDRASLASALAASAPGAEARSSVVLVGLAGVQEFIENSRRTQDLWMGSLLYAYLMSCALEEVSRTYGPDCIMTVDVRGSAFFDRWLVRELAPNGRGHLGSAADLRRDLGLADHHLDVGSDRLRTASLPNRFAALVPSAEAASIAGSVRRRVGDEARSVGAHVRARVEAAARELEGAQPWRRQWEMQLLAWPDEEVFWAATEMASLDEYGDASIRAARAFAARKRVRDFGQLDPDRELPGDLYRQPCTLCERRHALQPPDGARTRAALSRFWEGLAQKEEGVKLAGRFRHGEQLCAVCLTKRLANEAFFVPQMGLDHHLFPSTSSIAASGFLADLVPLGLDAEAGALAGALEAIPPAAAIRTAPLPFLRRETAARGRGADGLQRLVELDGDWLHPDLYFPAVYEAEFGVAPPLEPLDQARRARDHLLGAARSSPGTYYAVVMADGDELGRWLQGQRNLMWSALVHDGDERLHVRRPLGPMTHAALRRAALNFSALCSRLETGLLARAVYAGGDDALFIAAVRAVPALLARLRGLYREPYNDDRLLMGPAATISAGVAIAHHAQPFTEAIEDARDALETSKHARRDRLTIVVTKRSGSVDSLTARWEVLDDLAHLVEDVREQRASPSSAYALRGLEAGIAALERSSFPDAAALVAARSGPAISSRVRSTYERLHTEVSDLPAVDRLAALLRLAAFLAREW